MKVVRITQVSPTKGNEEHVDALIRQLGDHMSKQPGFIEDYEFRAPGKIGRVSIWSSHEAADVAANLTHTIAIRSHIHLLSTEWQETMAEIEAEHHAG